MNKLFPLILCLFLTNSCVMVYKTSEERKSFLSVKKQAVSNIEKAEKDKHEKQKGYDWIISNISDPDISPYPKLKNILNKMDEHISSLYDLLADQEKIFEEFETFSKGKNKIESSDKSDWNRLSKIRENYKGIIDKMSSVFQKYNNSSSSFISIANKHKIGKVNIVNIENQVDSYLNKLDDTIVDINNQITRYHNSLNSIEGQRKKIHQKQIILDDLEKIIEDVSKSRKELSRLVEKFRDEATGNMEIWSGPGMLTHTIIKDIKKIGNRINKKGKKFNELAKKL